MNISEVVVKNRARQDMGDLQALADSIAEVGLLHPVVVNTRRELVAGERRLRACQDILGWEKIPATMAANLDEVVKAEQAEEEENTCRKQLLPTEAVARGRQVEPIVEEEAKERQGGPGRDRSDKLPEQSTERTRDKVGAIVGMSGSTYRKAEAVVEAAEEDPETFGGLVEQMDKTGKVDGAHKKLKRKRKQIQEEAAKVQISEEARKSLTSVCDVRHMPMSAFFRSGIKPDCVITDPPYGKEFLRLYSELAYIAKFVPLVAVMCGQSYLPEVFARMSEHLTYRWTIAYLTPGGQSAQLWDRKINSFWKPVLVFGQSEEWAGDVCRSAVNDNDKQHHPWGQSESGMMRLVEMLTQPGQLVCDPFVGGGTTALASLRLGRRFVGCDIEEASVKTTLKRCEVEYAGGQT